MTVLKKYRDDHGVMGHCVILCRDGARLRSDAANLLQYKPSASTRKFLKAQQATEALQGAMQRASKGIGGDEWMPRTI